MENEIHTLVTRPILFLSSFISLFFHICFLSISVFIHSVFHSFFFFNFGLAETDKAVQQQKDLGELIFFLFFVFHFHLPVRIYK